MLGAFDGREHKSWQGQKEIRDPCIDFQVVSFAKIDVASKNAMLEIPLNVTTRIRFKAVRARHGRTLFTYSLSRGEQSSYEIQH